VSKGKHISYELKVAMCADYLIGLSLEELKQKYGGSAVNISKWIAARKCFKLRKPQNVRQTNNQSNILA